MTDSELIDHLAGLVEKATPGEWKAGETDQFGDITITPVEGGLAIAAIPNGEFMRMGGLADEHKANADLVAACNPENIKRLLELARKGAEQ